MHELIQEICAQQSPGGTFLSKVHLASGDVEDLNCFVSALVLRELSRLQREVAWSAPPELQNAGRRALGFLMRSKYPVYPHLYSFYPRHKHPLWMGPALYADADDTSIIALELVRYQKRPPEILSYIAERYLMKYRAMGDLAHHLTEPWHREGVFLTWFTTADLPNPIDCCVNANVMALLAVGDLKATPGYAEAGALINEAVAWAGHDRRRLRQLTPYYPHPIELYHAVDHAVASGVHELVSARDALAGVPCIETCIEEPIVEADGPVEPVEPHRVCSSVDGEIYWTAEVLGQVRELKRSIMGGE